MTTEAERALVHQNVEALYRGNRRSWQGFGGTGNPYETWDDLKGMAGLSFVMDPDAVFTTTGWGASRLIDLAKKLQLQADALIGATEQLVSSAKSVQDLDPLIRSYAMLTQQSLEIRRSGRADVGAPRLAAIQKELTGFAQENLVPSVTTAQQDGSNRSPAEARAYIRTGTVDLFALMTQTDTAIESLSGAVPGMQATVPTRVALGWMQKITDRVSGMQIRMQLQPPKDRAGQAMQDLTQLSADLTTLDLTGRSSSPTLERGAFSCVAAGSGDGAVIQGVVSAPYRLITGVSDVLRLKVDAAPATVVTLPSSAPTITVQFAKPASMVGPPPPTIFYTVPAAPPSSIMAFVVNGVVGASPAVFAAGANLTTTQVVAALNVAGVIPVDALAVPYLLIDEIPLGDPALGINTVRIRYNPAATPGMNPGAYIMISGNEALMEVFGFVSTFDYLPGYMLHVAEWKATSQAEVFLALTNALSPGVLIQPPYQMVSSGTASVGGLSGVAAFSHYFGTGTWESTTSKLTLSGDDLRKVIVGDKATLDGNTVGVVQAIESDGLVIDTTGFAPIVSGTPYVASVVPVGIQAGMTLELTFQNRTSYYRITGVAALPGDGRLGISMSQVPYLDFFASRNVDARVVMDVQRLRSADNGPAGSLELVAGSTAAADLGMSLGLVTSSVDQLEVPSTSDLVAAGVVPGDIVRPATGPDWVVDEVISTTRLRVTTPVAGTFDDDVTIYNHRYIHYNESLVNQFSIWDAAPSQEDIQREAAEATRAEGMTLAGNALKALLLQLKTAAYDLQQAVLAYRGKSGAPSPYMQDLREAFEEAGADRAVDYLQAGRIREMLSFTADDANTSRQLLKTMRVLGRKGLGTSVYVAAREQEQNALLRQSDQVYTDATLLPVEEIGPPRRALR
jgi:hypothetical protein